MSKLGVAGARSLLLKLSGRTYPLFASFYNILRALLYTSKLGITIAHYFSVALKFPGVYYYHPKVNSVNRSLCESGRLGECSLGGCNAFVHRNFSSRTQMGSFTTRLTVTTGL